MFDPVRICKILNEESVDYVVIGGFAAVIHGSSLPTRDLDIVPERSTENLDRLGRALHRLNAMIRTADEPVPAPLDGSFLANVSVMLNLVTDFGDMDVAFSPSGHLGGFEGWSRHATAEELGTGLTVLVGSLDDIIDSKKSANRLKDRRDLPYLESLRDVSKGDI
ncbi:MAG: hypothetical protein ACKOYO_05425 [Actinomycetota bacterium]